MATEVEEIEATLTLTLNNMTRNSVLTRYQARDLLDQALHLKDCAGRQK